MNSGALSRPVLQMLVLVFAVPSVASAQSPGDRTLRSLTLTEFVLPATADPTGTRAAIEPISSATVATGAGGTVGKFTLGFKLGDDNYAHVTLSAPATDGRTVLELGDELPSGTKATFAFGRLIGFGASLDSQSPAQSLRTLTARPTREALRLARQDLLAAARSGELSTRPGLLITGTVDYGRQKFTYREEDAGPDLDPQLRESQGGTVNVGVLFGPSGTTTATYVGAGYRVSRGWKAATPKNRCTPVGSSNITECTTATIGPPTEQKKESFSVELRQHIGTIFGWTPLFAYDREADKGRRALVEVPLYLVTDGASNEPKLTGGVALGWREGRGAYAAVFVGPKFSLLGQ